MVPVGAAMLLSIAGTGDASETNRLSKLTTVAVENDRDDVVVRLSGSRSPDVSTHTEKEPRFRVVVDWAGSELSGVNNEQVFTTGLVRKLTARQVDAEAEKISRVTIELARETTFRLESKGNQLLVRLAKVELPPDAVAAAPAAAPAPAANAAPGAPKAEPAPAAKGPLTEPAAPPPAPAKTEVAAAPAAPAPATIAKAAPAARANQEKAAARTAPDNGGKVAPAPKETTLAAFVPSDANTAHQTADGSVVTRAPAPEPARLSAQPAAQPKPAPAAREAAPATLASFQPKPAAAKAPAPAMAPAGPAPADRPVAFAKAEDAQVVKPKAAAASAADEFDPGPRVMTYIGFRINNGASEVFVRADGKARYSVEKAGDRLVIELHNTRVNVKNNERALDTSYFKTPVTRVQAQTVGANTRVEIDLRENVAHTVKRTGNTISVEFQPGA